MILIQAGTAGPTSKHGEDLYPGPHPTSPNSNRGYNSAVFWTEDVNFNSAIWDIADGRLPTLR
jgi:hypothetical protein